VFQIADHRTAVEDSGRPPFTAPSSAALPGSGGELSPSSHTFSNLTTPNSCEVYGPYPAGIYPVSGAYQEDDCRNDDDEEEDRDRLATYSISPSSPRSGRKDLTFPGSPVLPSPITFTLQAPMTAPDQMSNNPLFR
jgi:hypothetical protein